MYFVSDSEVVYDISMAPRRRPREGVAEQATRPEVGDAPPPQQTQPLPQDSHSGIVPPPPPPPQVAQGLDMTRFLEGMAQFVAQHRDAPVPQGGTGRTAAALEADTLRTRARSAEVQTQVVPSQPHQQQGSVQTTPRTTTSYASTSTGTTEKSGSRRKFRRDRRQAEQRQQSVGSVQQPTGQPLQQVQHTFAGQCYRCDQIGHMARDCPLLPRVPQQQTQSQPRVQQQQQ
ncbi:hypothetical protein Taro_004824, partial [Colocasia esculenta]|nr:hypothetical protein [Colocasia esculenta]